MKSLFAFLVCFCIILLFYSFALLTNPLTENFNNNNIFAEGNRGGDNGDPLPLPPNPPPPPPPGFV
jgi:hypothetical protein